MSKKWKKKLKKQKAIFLQEATAEKKANGKSTEEPKKIEEIKPEIREKYSRKQPASRFTRPEPEVNEIARVISDLDEETKLVKDDIRKVGILTAIMIVLLIGAAIFDQKYNWIIHSADIIFKSFKL